MRGIRSTPGIVLVLSREEAEKLKRTIVRAIARAADQEPADIDFEGRLYNIVDALVQESG